MAIASGPVHVNPGVPLQLERGFSLLEMLVVTALLAVAGLLAMAVVGGGQHRGQVHASVKEISANLRHARALAIASGEPQQFRINPGERAWQGARGRQGRIPDGMSVIFTGAREIQPQAGEGAILFFDDGASTGGQVVLASGDVAWTIDVAWLTGRIEVRRGHPD